MPCNDVPLSDEVIVEYFKLIISQTNSTSSCEKGSPMKGRRTLTSQHVDRYIFCLNYVIERGFAPIVDLVKGIKSELEFNRSYHIDKKTVKRIIEILLSEGLLEV